MRILIADDPCLRNSIQTMRDHRRTSADGDSGQKYTWTDEWGLTLNRLKRLLNVRLDAIQILILGVEGGKGNGAHQYIPWNPAIPSFPSSYPHGMNWIWVPRSRYFRFVAPVVMIGVLIEITSET